MAIAVDLTQFSLADMTALSAALRRMGSGPRSLEEAARRVVDHVRRTLVDPRTGRRSCALVRLFKTHPLGSLPPDLRRVGEAQLGDSTRSPDVQCLTLLASAGDRPEWNDRHGSRGHRVIPLPSHEAIARIPMLSQLVKQLGIDIDVVLRPPENSILMEIEQRTYNVFHVPEARGSSFIPAQDDFVVPCGIRSVMGFGGILTGGSMFATILFSHVSIPRQTADLFKTIAVSIKVAVTPFSLGPIFDPEPSPAGGKEASA